ncbi:MAG: hypothetical protein ABR936_05565 [Bacteroidota bacterium]|jgi:hypothetical protein
MNLVSVLQFESYQRSNLANIVRRKDHIKGKVMQMKISCLILFLFPLNLFGQFDSLKQNPYGHKYWSNYPWGEENQVETRNDSFNNNPYGQIYWTNYPKPWDEYKHEIIVDSIINISNGGKSQDIVCHCIITQYHLPEDFPCIYSFDFNSPSNPSLRCKVIDTSYETPSSLEDWFSFIDLNFDGYKDLKYTVTPKVRSDNPVWIFNPNTLTFEYKESFDGISISGMSDIDTLNKTISNSDIHFYSRERDGITHLHIR